MFLVLSMFLKRFYFSFRSYTSYTPVASKKTGVFMADDLDVSEFGAMSTAGNPKSFHEFNPNLETTCMNLSSRFVERDEFKMGDAGAPNVRRQEVPGSSSHSAYKSYLVPHVTEGTARARALLHA